MHSALMFKASVSRGKTNSTERATNILKKSINDCFDGMNFNSGIQNGIAERLDIDRFTTSL